MLNFIADLSFAVLTSSGGAGAGWLLHRVFARKPVQLPEEQRFAGELVGRLKEMAVGMAADVGKHTSRVEEINQELTLAENPSPEGVVSAVARLIESNQSMQTQLSAVEDKLQEQSRLVEMKAAEARTDALTGLANRRAFDDRVAECHADFQRSRLPFALILGDIDHFKKFNDTHGHQTGDEVLKGTARVLRQSARETDFVARYGGEEMAVVLPGTKAEEAIRCLERGRQAIESARFRSPNTELKVTMSFGVAELLPGEDVPGLIRRADAALYAAKQSGRNRGCWHDGHGIRPIARPCDIKPAAKAEKPVATDNPPAPPAAPQLDRTRLEKPQAEMAPAERPVPDELGLCSQQDFGVSLGRRLAEWRRRGTAPAVMLMRIDDFASLKGRYGQETAGLVLRSAVQFLTASIRAMDLGGHHGESAFAMLLPGASAAELVRVAERLRQAVARCVLPINGQSVRFTVSVAAATAVQSDTPETMLARAEEALALAAVAGGNCSFLHNGQQAEPCQAVMERMRAAMV